MFFIKIALAIFVLLNILSRQLTASASNYLSMLYGYFMPKILFLCSKNKLRSPTAETIFSDVEGWEVYSAGISNDAEVHVSLEDIEWADYIFVMENIHKKKLIQKFGKYINIQSIISLGIPDDFKYMDEALIEILRSKVPRHVQ